MSAAAPALSQLQTCVSGLAQMQQADDATTLDTFEWMSKDMLTLLTFTVTAAHAMHVGQTDRVHR
jgi:hypothetical protein